jgi:hypothetical protein
MAPRKAEGVRARLGLRADETRRTALEGNRPPQFQGVLYGTTLGGNGVAGTVFGMTPPTTSGAAWTLSVLHSFPYNSEDGQNFSPNGAALIGPGGTLYTTTQGPSLQLGLAVALAPPSASGGDWTEYQIYALPGTPNAGGPAAGLVPEGASLFGTTFGGGDEGCGNFGCGTVYQLTPGAAHGSAWTETLLHTFTGSPADGGGPLAALAVGPGGVLYGTTQFGGSGSPSVCKIRKQLRMRHRLPAHATRNPGRPVDIFATL